MYCGSFLTTRKKGFPLGGEMDTGTEITTHTSTFSGYKRLSLRFQVNRWLNVI